MYTDLFGNTRCRVNLHTHTTLSDGARSPAEVARLYHDAGYDALALTDHWTYGEAGEFEGMTILSGAEYNVKVCSTRQGLFHIVGVGMTQDPELPFQSTVDARASAEVGWRVEPTPSVIRRTAHRGRCALRREGERLRIAITSSVIQRKGRRGRRPLRGVR